MSDVPTVTTQNLIDAGLNVFGLQLFLESVARKKDAATFKPLSFVFMGVKVTIEPEVPLPATDSAARA